jgi:DNA-binding LacI/PurR family transcriptional regulator/anti-anti-sigma regulatory factor/putative methionine-R-sulfoxide reductase with GAF domain
MSNQKGAKSVESASSRPTIGVLGEVGRSPYHRTLWEGFVTAARELDVNLIWFLSLPFTASDLDAPRSIFQKAVIGQRVDGLLISGTLGNFIPAADFKGILDPYRSLPMVGITETPGLPSAVVDNEVGMRGVVTHLVEVHGYRRVAFIRGPEDNKEAALRYRAYADVLVEHDIPLDPDLVAPGSFSTASGQDAMRLLLDEREVEFEVIVAANDLMAFGALAVLEKRGVRVPGDVALVGFDNTKEAAASSPPLTTVRQPIHQLGEAGIKAMLKLLAGEEVPEQVVLPTALVVRRSCGCVNPLVEGATIGSVAKRAEPLKESIAGQRAEIISELAQTAGERVPFAGWAERLLDAFLQDLYDATVNGADAELVSSGRFVTLLEDWLRRIDFTGRTMNDWQAVISVIRRRVAPHMPDVATLLRAEDLFNAGRVVIGKMIEEKWALQEVEDTAQNAAMSSLRDELTMVVEKERIWDVLDTRLPQLGFSNAFLSFYDGQEHDTQWSKLALAYAGGERLDMAAVGQRFPTGRLIPGELVPRERRYTWLAAPLAFGDNEFGYLILETGPRSVEIYQILARLVSGALQDSMLIQQLDFRRVQMLAAAEISRAATSMLDLQALIQKAVELVQERFGLYYVGLFLLEGGWAVLRAATGEAGKEMLEQGHRLQLGGDSMVGQCIADQQACIALDVGQEAVRFDNPLLPETRSELALPLVGREGAIGALSIQSVREKAFGEADLAVFQTIADQLANAIANARLYEKVQQAYAEVEQQVRERTEELQREQEESARLQQEVIEAQKRAIQELSTPIIPVMERVIVVPLIGSIDTLRARDVTRRLLAGIREHRAKVVILDITGVPIVDSGVAAYLNKTIQAARLKGARTIVTGVSDAVAETIVDLGIDWSEIETLADLQTGLRAALQQRGPAGIGPLDKYR